MRWKSKGKPEFMEHAWDDHKFRDLDHLEMHDFHFILERAHASVWMAMTLLTTLNVQNGTAKYTHCYLIIKKFKYSWW